MDTPRQFGNEMDVTGTVKVSSAPAVRTAVSQILQELYPHSDLSLLTRAFDDFEQIFRGEVAGYRGCKTVYHDMQHTLDMTLAMARLIGGHDRTHKGEECFGSRLAMVGVTCALFHDSGYILRAGDRGTSGAEYTTTHVSRGAQFVEGYLVGVGLAEYAVAANYIVHMTGYEATPDDDAFTDPRFRVVGNLLGTADLMAQMADRCYLEKCRDRLFPEFVLGGLVGDGKDGAAMQFRSGHDLLKETPKFFEQIFRDRLNSEFNRSYHLFEAWFDGENPYLDAIVKNARFLQKVLQNDSWELLRRKPPLVTSDEESLEETNRLAVKRLREMLTSDAEHNKRAAT
ncbi:MAG: hypothetical protein AAGA68_03630 [Pseudomonadota bacterium]